MRQRGRAGYQIRKRWQPSMLAWDGCHLFNNRQAWGWSGFAKRSCGIRMIVGLRERSGAIRRYYHKVERSAAQSWGRSNLRSKLAESEWLHDCESEAEQSVGIITKWLGAPPNHENVVICSANRQIPPIPSVSFYKNSLKKQKVEKRSFKIHQSNI